MRHQAILAMCAAAGLAACGGGGSSTGTTATDDSHTTSGGEAGGGGTTAGTDGGGATAGTDGGGTTAGGGDSQAFAAAVAAGQAKFDHVCGTCHPEGSEDTGPDLHNKHLTIARVTDQIRNGSSHMRPIPVARLSDEELPNVLAWLSTIGTVDGVSR